VRALSPASPLVNGRFLRTAAPTGLHRAGRALLDGLVAAGTRLEVVAPRGVCDPRVTWTLPGPPGRPGDHAWEQVVLPAVAGRRPVVSLANTAPLAARRAAVLVQDLAPLASPGWFTGPMQLYVRAVLIAARRADVVVAPSAFVADELVRHGVARTRIHVVANAVDGRFTPAPAAAVAAVRTRFGLERDYLVHIGWPNPRKDATTAVLAHLRAAASRPHDLVLVGATHRTFGCVPRPAGPSLRVLGHVTDEELVPLLTGARALVYPSLYEGFGLPPLEAAACGTAAIASDIPVLRATAAGAAVYAPPGDVDAWAAQLRRALDGELSPGRPPAWTWDDAARAFRCALAAHLDIEL